MVDTIMGLPIAIWAAIIGLTGSVILGPIFTRFIAKIFEKKSQLLVSVRASDITPCPYLKILIPVGSDMDVSSKEWEIRRIFRHLKGCIVLKISNSGNDTIKSVTLSLDNGKHFEGVVQISEAETVSLFNSQEFIELGDLQPLRSIEVNIYSSIKVSDYGLRFFRQDLRVSADKIDRVVHRFELPDYLRFLKDERKNKLISRTLSFFMIFFFGLFLLGLYRSMHQ